MPPKRSAESEAMMAKLLSGSQSASDRQRDLDRQEEEVMNMSLGDLDLDTEEINFDEVDEDLAKFQQDEIVKEALSKGVDLRNYSRQIEQELQTTEALCIADYVREADKLAALHFDIKSCDAVLERMQFMLGQFQTDLGLISSEIKDLQDQSMTLSIQLKNRTAAEALLTEFVADLASYFIAGMVVSQSLVNTICERPVDEPSYIVALNELDQKIRFIRRPEAAMSRAALDVSSTIDRLRLKAIQRIREELLRQFHKLKQVRTNFQLKQTVLLKLSPLYDFLVQHSSGSPDPALDVAGEIRRNYIDTMSGLFLQAIRIYLTDLKKLHQDATPMTRMDTLGVDCSLTGGFFSVRRTEEALIGMFSLNQRESVLADSNKEYIICHVASTGGLRYPYERIFRSAHLLTIETCCNEWDFLCDFFGGSPADAKTEHGSPADAKTEQMAADGKGPASATAGSRKPVSVNEPLVRQIFNGICERTFQFFLETLDAYLTECFDVVGLLIMLRVLHQHNAVLQLERVHCMDSFADSLNKMLWARLKAVLDLNLASVQQVPASLTGSMQTTPHFMCARYAEFACSIWALNKTQRDDILEHTSARFRAEVDKLLSRSAGRILVPKSQLIFLINNYSTIHNLLVAKATECEQVAHYRELISTNVAFYVEEELAEKFGKLIAFVRTTESQLNKAPEGSVTLDNKEVESIVRHFASNWREGIEQINSNIQRNFSYRLAVMTRQLEEGKSATSAEIFKQVLMQLVLYNQRFQDILKKVYRRPQAWNKDFVATSIIMYEIKRYTHDSEKR